MGKIEEKKRQKKEALLASAFDLFTKKGIDNTSVLEITKNANMAKGTFYLYFQDKYKIRDYLIAQKANLVFQKANTEFEEWLHRGASPSFEESIIFLTDSILAQLNQNPDLLRFISKNLSWGGFSNIRFAEGNNQNCIALFDSLFEKFHKRYREKELMIYMIVELVNATCYNVILNHIPVGLDTLKKELYITIQGILHQFEYA